MYVYGYFLREFEGIFMFLLIFVNLCLLFLFFLVVVFLALEVIFMKEFYIFIGLFQVIICCFFFVFFLEMELLEVQQEIIDENFIAEYNILQDQDRHCSKIKLLQQSIKIMQQSLLKSSRGNQYYDPFQSPPQISKSQLHYKATKVGLEIDQLQSLNICPCCENVIQKEQISLTCNDEQLLYLGVGYPLYYKLTRYFGIIIFMIFVVSGSGFYFLVTLNCQHNCVYFFGIPIINLEISGEDSAELTDIVHMIAAFAIFGCVLYVKGKIRVDIQELEKKVVLPDQYTIMLQNLPENINDEDLIQWSNQKFEVKPILINFAYNVTQLSNSYTTRQNLTIQLNKTLIKKNNKQTSTDQSTQSLLDCQVKQLRQKIQALDNLIDLYRQQKITCHKLGTVFLTYQSQETVQKILSKYQNSLFKTFINMVLSPFKTPPLLFRSSTVIVTSAPGPREVIWQNLSYSFLRSVIAQIFFIIIMIVVLIFSFKGQYHVVNLAYRLRHEGKKSGEVVVVVQALAMSVVVVIVNSLLRLLIKLFAYFKKYYSFSSYHSSFCFYYSISYIFNTCFMIYIVHGHRDLSQIKPLQQQNILIYDIHLIMLANAFSQPLYKIIDPEMWFRVFRRKYFQRLPKQKNPYTQSYFNMAWEGYQISVADNYQYIFRVLVITTWFAHSAPLGVVFSMLGLFLDYWIGKYILVRYSKRPESISKQLATPMIASLQLLPLIYICGVLQFTYKVSSSQNIFEFIVQFLKYGVTIIIILICILGYIIIYKKSQESVNKIPYNEVQQRFAYNYQTQNPITKFKGEMKYLYGILKKGVSEPDQRIIRNVLELGIGDRSSERQSVIAKIKFNRLKRLETLNSQENKNEMQRRYKNSTSSDTSNKRSEVQMNFK